ncbi:MAG: toprim domain-containing protein, partial [Bacteroidota bacterium]|nr:toprim domain-containing protein [Bacteroidota bacterium]
MAEQYTEESIKTLDWYEHIRRRPGMYIGKLGDGSSQDDGIYVLIKEIIDNSVDEFIMGYGKTIELTINEKKVTVRDYGRGIPLGSVIDCVGSINTGAKYDSEVFKKTVGLNGVGSKAVNALSSYFKVRAVRDGKEKIAEFMQGKLTNDIPVQESKSRNGTIISFVPDEEIFGDYHFISEYIDKLLWNYVFLNTGMTIILNGQKYFSPNGLLDLVSRNLDSDILYPIIHIKEADLEFALTHCNQQYVEEYYSFVNGQHTTQGGTHLNAFKEAVCKTIREFYKKDFDASDIKLSIIGAVSIKIQEPVFESQTKTKLGSTSIEPNGLSIKTFVSDIVGRRLDNYLHKNPETADALLKKILQSEKDRKDFADIKKLSRESSKKTSLNNRKLRDCRVHYNSTHESRLESTLFITEGDSASGSITKSRDVTTQAVFSLRGKPLNSLGKSKKFVYENEEFKLLQSALDIEDGLDNLRYNNIVIATDADVDGMHIRLLLLTFFLQFFAEVVRKGHLYILQTPLFRVRKKNKNI